MSELRHRLDMAVHRVDPARPDQPQYVEMGATIDRMSTGSVQRGVGEERTVADCLADPGQVLEDLRSIRASAPVFGS